MTENKTMQTPKEDMRADDHIKNTQFELIQLLKNEDVETLSTRLYKNQYVLIKE